MPAADRRRLIAKAHRPDGAAAGEARRQKAICALVVLLELMSSSNDDRVRAAAAEAVLNRLDGKPRQVGHESDHGEAVRFVIYPTDQK